MSGIAGVTGAVDDGIIDAMLDKISYRGKAERCVRKSGRLTLGVVSCSRNPSHFLMAGDRGVQDYTDRGRYARAMIADGQFLLERDPLGVASLYCGIMKDGEICFASEIKALLDITKEIYEVPPGCRSNGKITEQVFHLNGRKPLNVPICTIKPELRRRIESSIGESLEGEEAGSWLSAGLNTCIVAALARPHFRRFHTYAIGFSGSPSFEFSRHVAGSIRSEHHEKLLNFEDVLKILPRVIYHLESFDAKVVRAGVVNYLAAGMSSDHVQKIYCGEGGDELFAGYDYLRALSREALSDELIDITKRMHNTTLQRLDRCSGAFGLTTHVAFFNPEVLDYVLRIPVEYKFRDGVEEWILRESMVGLLPENILGSHDYGYECSGVGERLKEYAENTISMSEFYKEHTLPNGWTLRGREELLYYRILRDHFGELPRLTWLGRTKNDASRGVGLISHCRNYGIPVLA